MKNKRKEKSPSPATVKFKESFKNISNNPLKMSILLGLLGIVSLTLIIFIMLRFTIISKIEIDADMSFYNESKIIEASGIGEGDSIIKLSSAKIKKNLKTNLPLISKVSVSKSIFGKLKIKLAYRDYQFFYKYDGGYAAVDSALTVKDTRNSKREYLLLGAKYLSLPETEVPEINKKAVFSSTTLEKDDENYRGEEYYSYITFFLKAIAGSDYYENTNAVLINEKFNIILIYDNKYEILFGNSGDTELKLSVLDNIIKGEQLIYAKGAVIDLTNPAKPSARVDNNLDFSEYIIEDETEFESISETETDGST